MAADAGETGSNASLEVPSEDGTGSDQGEGELDVSLSCPSDDEDEDPTVPAAIVPKHLDGTLPDDFMEIFTAPRVVPVCCELGLRASLSVDLLTGWDLLREETQHRLNCEIERRRPAVIMSSPPCTMYSPLMTMWNLKRMDPEKVKKQLKDADALYNYNITVGIRQCRWQRYFVMEHPARASSWKKPCVKDLARDYDMHQTTFDQCRVGLLSPVSHIPMKKTTILLHNIAGLHKTFANLRCNSAPVHMIGGVKCKHKRIEGCEGPHRLSRWAQYYPAAMVSQLARAIHDHLNQLR